MMKTFLLITLISTSVGAETLPITLHNRDFLGFAMGFKCRVRDQAGTKTVVLSFIASHDTVPQVAFNARELVATDPNAKDCNAYRALTQYDGLHVSGREVLTESVSDWGSKGCSKSYQQDITARITNHPILKDLEFKQFSEFDLGLLEKRFCKSTAR